MPPTDRPLILLTCGLLAAGGLYVPLHYQAAFPQASLHLPLSVEQITARAEAFLASRELAPAGFRNLTLFDPDENARLYLERELGLEQANQWMQGEAPVWRWRARWFRPPDKEERIVWLRPDGALTAFEHRIAEDAPGARLEREAARALALAFLRAQTQTQQDLISEESVARPARTDHQFTWEQRGFRVRDATLRRTVVVQGDRVGRYQEELHIPEEWQRDFARLRSGNELYATIANGLFAVLAVAAAVGILTGLRRRAIPWRLWVRLSGVVAGLYFLNEMNTLAFTLDRMPTSAPLSEMAALALLQALGAACGVLLYVLTPAAAGAPYRQPVARPGTRSYFRAALAGYAMAGAHLIFLTAFYLYGAKWGVWSPQDVDYSDLLATPLPWVYPVAIALVASTAEEFWFRWFAIPLLLRLLPWRWVAVAIPAFVWGFLHANYPQQPSYIRGIEVGIIGIAAGWVMLRYGIVATLIWHYVIDAFLMGLFLFRGETWQYRANAIVTGLAILAPVLLAGWLYRRHHGFLPEAAAAEEAPAAPAAPPPLAVPPPVEVRPAWPASRLYLAAALCGLLGFLFRPETFGGDIRLSVTRSQAIARAETEMRRRGLDPASWRVVADFSPNLRETDAEYLRREAGLARANQIARERLHAAVWRVRYFRPLQAEEWRFYVDQSGAVFRLDHLLDEKAPGAQLTAADARAVAEQWLRSRYPKADYSLAESSEDKHDNRTDHAFTWEDRTFRVGEARFRVSLRLVGDEACEQRAYLHLPEGWLREFRRPRLHAYALPALLGALGVALLLLFLRLLTRPFIHLHWRSYARPVLVVCGAAILQQFNRAPVWMLAYDTATPLDHHWMEQITGAFLGLLGTGGGVAAALLAASVFLQAALPGVRLPGFSVRKALAVATLTLGGSSLLGWARLHLPGPHREAPLWEIAGIDEALPAFGAFVENLTAAVMLTAAGAAAICGLLLLLNKSQLARAVILAGIAAAAGQALTVWQFPLYLLLAAAAACLLLVLLLTCANDLYSIGAGLFLALTFPDVVRYAQQPASFFRWQAAVLFLLSVAAIAVFQRYEAPGSGRSGQACRG